MDDDLPGLIGTSGAWGMDWVVDFCLQHGIPRLNILPFIPRGSGCDRRKDDRLAAGERRGLRDAAKAKHRALLGHLDLRGLDFNLRPVPVVEPDGRLVWEGASEGVDRVICWIENVVHVPV